MVPGDEHPSLIHRSGPGDDIERDLLALEEVLIASEQHMADSQGLARAAVKGHGVGLQIPPEKVTRTFPAA